MKYMFIITDEEDIVVYESEEQFDTYEAAEEMAQEWCSDYSQGATAEDPDAECDSYLDYDVVEVED